MAELLLQIWCIVCPAHVCVVLTGNISVENTEGIFSPQTGFSPQSQSKLSELTCLYMSRGSLEKSLKIVRLEWWFISLRLGTVLQVQGHHTPGNVYAKMRRGFPIAEPQIQEEQWSFAGVWAVWTTCEVSSICYGKKSITDMWQKWPKCIFFKRSLASPMGIK